MKNTLFLAVAALFFSATVSAQSTVDSIAAKYKLLPMPGPLTVDKTFPVLGEYQLVNSADSAAALTVTLDSASKGIVWIDGLPQGRVKAYLRKSPATYRIIAQKTESGKQVPEGTVMLDTATKTLNIALGAPYNETTPEAIFAFNNGTPDDNTVEVKAKSKTAKTKAKVTYYTANKVVTTPPVNADEQTDNQQNNQNNQQGTGTGTGTGSGNGGTGTGTGSGNGGNGTGSGGTGTGGQGGGTQQN